MTEDPVDIATHVCHVHEDSDEALLPEGDRQRLVLARAVKYYAQRAALCPACMTQDKLRLERNEARQERDAYRRSLERSLDERVKLDEQLKNSISLENHEACCDEHARQVALCDIDHHAEALSLHDTLAITKAIDDTRYKAVCDERDILRTALGKHDHTWDTGAHPYCLECGIDRGLLLCSKCHGLGEVHSEPRYEDPGDITVYPCPNCEEPTRTCPSCGHQFVYTIHRIRIHTCPQCKTEFNDDREKDDE